MQMAEELPGLMYREACNAARGLVGYFERRRRGRYEEKAWWILWRGLLVGTGDLLVKEARGRGVDGNASAEVVRREVMKGKVAEVLKERPNAMDGECSPQELPARRR